MRINGTEIASSMYEELAKRVKKLQTKKITPHLVVLLVGESPASVAYVTLKQKRGEEIGAKVTVLKFDPSVTTEELASKVKLLNDDPFVHGILIQRPLPEHIDVEKLELLTNPQKDIDGFHPKSPYTLPLPLAVAKILEHVCILETMRRVTKQEGHPTAHSDRRERALREGMFWQDPEHKIWLHTKHIVLLGKGPTGGGPILAFFKTLGVTPILIDSKTKDPHKVMKQADVVISAVGRENVVKAKDLKQGVILISVGILRGKDKKLSGDYVENDIKDIASYYTPTPGGVGPVNVAKLIENLLTAAERQNK